MKRHIERQHIAKAQSRLGSINRFVAGCEIDKVIAFVRDIHCQAQPADGRWRRVWVASEEDVVYQSINCAPSGGKNTNYAFHAFSSGLSRFFRSLMLTPMVIQHSKTNRKHN